MCVGGWVYPVCFGIFGNILTARPLTVVRYPTFSLLRNRSVDEPSQCKSPTRKTQMHSGPLQHSASVDIHGYSNPLLDRPVPLPRADVIPEERVTKGSTLSSDLNSMGNMNDIVHGSRNQNDSKLTLERVSWKKLATFRPASTGQYLGQITDNPCAIKARKNGSKHR